MKKHLFLLLMFFATITPASADILILEPANDNSVYNDNFVVTAYINESNIKTAQYRVVGYPWVDLEQITTTEWQGSINISQYDNGTYTLSAKYNKNNDLTWVYAASATQFTILKPTPHQNTNNTTFTAKKNFRIEYGDGLRLGRSVFLKVFNKDTGEPVEGANVSIFDGLGTQSLFGRTTSNGRVFAGVPNMDNDREYEIIIDKAGYNDYSEFFTAWIVKPTATPTPPPTPTPAPTPTKRFFPDLGQYVTDDEYKAWQEAQELKKRNESLAQLTPTPQPTQSTSNQEDDWPWGLALAAVIILVSIYIVVTMIWGRANTKKESTEETHAAGAKEMQAELLQAEPPKSELTDLICDKCGMSIAKVAKDFPFREIVLKEHYEIFHKEETAPEKTEKEKKDRKTKKSQDEGLEE